MRSLYDKLFVTTAPVNQQDEVSTAPSPTASNIAPAAQPVSANGGVAPAPFSPAPFMQAIIKEDVVQAPAEAVVQLEADTDFGNQLAQGTTSKAPMAYSAPEVIVKGVDVPPDGVAYMLRDATLKDLEPLSGEALAQAVMANGLFGDTPELRALANRLDPDGVVSMFARQNLAGPRPPPEVHIMPKPVLIKRERTYKKMKRSELPSVFSVFGVEVPPAAEKSKVARKKKNDGGEGRGGAKVTVHA